MIHREQKKRANEIPIVENSTCMQNNNVIYALIEYFHIVRVVQNVLQTMFY